MLQLRLSLSVMDSERTVRECRSSESGEAREQRLARDRARQRERRASETAETRERRLAREREQRLLSETADETCGSQRRAKDITLIHHRQGTHASNR